MLTESGCALAEGGAGADRMSSRQIPHRPGRAFSEVDGTFADTFTDIFSALADLFAGGCRFLFLPLVRRPLGGWLG